MSVHTPGPWFVWAGHADVFAGTATENTPGSLRGKFKPIAQSGHEDWECPPGEDEEDFAANADCEAEANAHLIAAAPELLEALEEMLAAHQREHGEARCTPCEQARPAIKKARGK